MSGPKVSRRIVFQGLGSLGVAAALAGCAGGEDGDSTGSGSDAGTGTTGSQADNEVASEAPSETGNDAGSEGAAGLIATGDVPVGGGVVLTEERIVITQPSEGEFRAFTAVCTHQGLTVTGVEGDTIRCDNHGSAYDAATGEVTGGPAPTALAEVAITVDGDQISTA